MFSNDNNSFESLKSVADAYVSMRESELADGSGADAIIEEPLGRGGKWAETHQSEPKVRDKDAIEMLIEAFNGLEGKPLNEKHLEVRDFISGEVGKMLHKNGKRFYRNYRDHHTPMEHLVYLLCDPVAANDAADSAGIMSVHMANVEKP